MKRTFFALLTLILSFSFIGSTKAALYSDASVGTYEQELAKFPCDYQTKIKALHNTYPNAVFVAQTVFFDWSKYKEVSVSWNDMVTAETAGQKSLIEASAPASYRKATCAQSNSAGCSWYIASQTGVEYYLNPYNFLDATYVFMFESQFYNTYQTETGVENILKSTFMANKNCPGSNKTYAAVIMEAAKKYDVSPYMLASRLKLENGKGTSSLVTGDYPGYTGYYNYFNIQASGSTDKEIIENGLSCAKGTLKNKNGKLVCDGNNWTSPYLSIIGGTKFIREQYIGVNDQYGVRGQMTGYLQKWDPYGAIYGGHQYMQNIRAPYFEAKSTYTSYSATSGYQNYRYVFHIPIFTGAPNTTNTSCSSATVTSIPYKTSNGYMSGITQGTTASTVATNTKGSVTNASGKTKTSGKIATGDKVKIGNNTYTVVIYGDVNGDGSISSVDYVKIKNHITGANKLSGASLQAADANRDGSIKSVDYVKVKNHIIGASKITQ